MDFLRIITILTWISLPTVMYGGYALLGLITQGNQLSDFQRTFFRAGHAHAGVLLLMALLYQLFLRQTALSPTLQNLGAVLVFVGILAQSGGFFLHMVRGQPGQASIGTTVTVGGALLLAAAILLLVYGLVTA